MSFASANDMLLFFNLLINTVNRNTIGCSDFLCNWITKMKSNPNKPSVIYVPINSTQKAVQHKWRESKLVILCGPSGVGKSACMLGESLKDLQDRKINKIYITRPLVTVDQEEMGFFPGTVDEKLLPYLASFSDVLGDLSHDSLSDFDIEFLALPLIRGRTIKNAILLVDECQNMSMGQLKAVLTRLGRNSKIVLAGDFNQSDLNYSPNPFKTVATKLLHIEGVSIFHFTPSDQLRDEFVTQINEALN